MPLENVCFRTRSNCFFFFFSQRLDVRGRIKVIDGQNRKSDEPLPLGLFALCTPFGPPSLLEIPHKEVMFKSKHKLDLSLVSMDQRFVRAYSERCRSPPRTVDIEKYNDNKREKTNKKIRYKGWVRYHRGWTMNSWKAGT